MFFILFRMQLIQIQLVMHSSLRIKTIKFLSQLHESWQISFLLTLWGGLRFQWQCVTRMVKGLMNGTGVLAPMIAPGTDNFGTKCP